MILRFSIINQFYICLNYVGGLQVASIKTFLLEMRTYCLRSVGVRSNELIFLEKDRSLKEVVFVALNQIISKHTRPVTAQVHVHTCLTL